jgi:hypothetical protein
MMSPLAQFLDDHGFDTELELLSVVVAENGDLALSLRGFPWWRVPPTSTSDPGILHLHLADIAKTSDHLAVSGEYGWQVFHLDALTEGHAVREQGRWVEIFGNAPLPAPEAFFLELHDVLKDMGALQEVSAYLQRERFSEFREVAHAQSYKILSAPEDIAQAARHLLEKQGANISYLPWGHTVHPDYPNLTEVQINDAWIVCRSATVVAD